MIISAAKATEAAKILGVELSTLSPDLLSKAYRSNAARAHPDKGGDLQDWANVSWAKEVLCLWLEKAEAVVQEAMEPGSCRACGGSGRVATARRGFGKPLTVMCVMCNGSGDVTQGGERAHFGGSE